MRYLFGLYIGINVNNGAVSDLGIGAEKSNKTREFGSKVRLLKLKSPNS